MTSLLKKCKNSLHSRFECLQTCSVICYVISYFYSIGCRIVNLVTAIGCVHIAESVGSRRELVANSCTHRRRRRDATKQFRGVGGVYWALEIDRMYCCLHRLLASCRPYLYPKCTLTATVKNSIIIHKFEMAKNTSIDVEFLGVYVSLCGS